MLATSALHLSDHRRRRQIAFRPGNSLGVGRGKNHLAPNCETSVVTRSFVDLEHQIIIHQRWTPTSRLIVHVLSSFIEYPNPFPNHAINHRIITKHLTDLVMNLTW